MGLARPVAFADDAFLQGAQAPTMRLPGLDRPRRPHRPLCAAGQVRRLLLGHRRRRTAVCVFVQV
jgi:hypothetical protein